MHPIVMRDLAMEIPIQYAKELATKLQADAVIVIGFRDEQYATTSYGRDRATCRAFARVCDRIHDDIGNGTIEIPDPMLYGNPFHQRSQDVPRTGSNG